MTRILIADDHPLFRLALTQAVRQAVPDAAVAQCASVDEVRAALTAAPDTDLVLLDLHMPGSQGLIGLVSLRAEFPTVAIILVSAHDDPAVIRRALAFGAAGFIPKRAGLDELARGLRAVLACEDWLPASVREALAGRGIAGPDRELAARLASLTPQQFRVLALVAGGKLNKQIADALGVQERTVKAHVSLIFRKLGVRNRTQAGVLLHQLELADPARAPLDA